MIKVGVSKEYMRSIYTKYSIFIQWLLVRFNVLAVEYRQYAGLGIK
jgi:hypothetical protein